MAFGLRLVPPSQVNWGEEMISIRFCAKPPPSWTNTFRGLRNEFDLPLAATGTDFQNKVWHALTTIPYGETWSYQDLANAIGNPKAVRAVGLANGKNPISIVVPCHRVIGKSGKLTGYAGGVERKQRLLALEQGTPL